jgi:hypothetical protein
MNKRNPVSMSEFRANMKKYLDLADSGEMIYIRRTGHRFYKLGVPARLPSFPEDFCQHGKTVGECLVAWCKHNPNNRSHK